MNFLYFTAIYTFICSLFVTQPLPETQLTKLTDDTKEMFQAILYDNKEAFNAAIQKVSNKNLQLSNGTTPLSFAIEQNKFEYCTELIKEEFLASPQDLIQARLMYTLESDPIKKELARICINFLEQYLQEKNLIPKISDIKRGKENLKQQLPNFVALMQHPDYLLIEATKNNDIIRMSQLIMQQNADPDTCINGSTPLSIAITQGFTQAVDFLIQHNASVSMQYVEKARVLMELSQGQPDGDLYYPATRDQKTAHYIHLNNTTYIYTRILLKLEEIASPQETPSASPKATPKATPTVAPTTSAFETPMLQRTNNPYRLASAPRRTPTEQQPSIRPKNSDLPPLAPRTRK